MAALNCRVEAATLFIQHGADVTIRNDQGQTALDAVDEKCPAMRELLGKYARPAH
jgi:hypothetical protein